MLTRAFLTVQGQQLAEPALSRGSRLLGEQGEQQQSQGVVVSAVVHRVLTAFRPLAGGQYLLRGHGGRRTDE